MTELFTNYASEPLYIRLYMYYRDQIIGGKLKFGDKLPSLRKCAAEFGLSKMTVESAYMQLTAEGYISAKSQSGYYVAEISELGVTAHGEKYSEENSTHTEPKYDLSGSSVDMKCFDFKLWQKYVKNALRCEKRLLSYGEAQGEYDLRQALSEYASKERGVVCSPSQIVIGAGVQSLIQLLCSLDEKKDTVVFSGTLFEQGRAIFEDRGYKVVTGRENYNGKSSVSFIYTSPSHSDKFGTVMNISQRINLLNFAREHNSIIIEDDYDSEFCYMSRPVSSLQGLDGGENVVYIGTMSKLLLPSIRISFMVLPEKLVQRYHERGKLYNQTASKTEQIALARYITDNRLITQIRKVKKRYETKSEMLKNAIANEINTENMRISDSGFIVYFDIITEKKAAEIRNKITEKSLKAKSIEQISQNTIRFFVSSASVDFDEIALSAKLLKNSLI